MPLMIHNWHMATEYCVWRLILTFCVWRLILKCCAWRVISKHCARRPSGTCQMPVRRQPDATFWNQASGARQTPARRQPDTMFWNQAFGAWFQNIVSDDRQAPARRNVSKSGVRCNISKSSARRNILWPCVRCAVLVQLCSTFSAILSESTLPCRAPEWLHNYQYHSGYQKWNADLELSLVI